MPSHHRNLVCLPFASFQSAGAFCYLLAKERMLLSEAIRIGATKRPQCIGSLFSTSNNGSCALGAAYEGIHPYNEDVSGDDIEELLYSTFPYLCNDTIEGVIIVNHILHMNDTKEMTREAIADWLAERGY